jgi:hypothetical protein
MPKLKGIQLSFLVALLVAGCGGGSSDAPPDPGVSAPLYGISLLYYNSESLAPFHPIPQAQAAIAAVLKQSFPGR